MKKNRITTIMMIAAMSITTLNMQFANITTYAICCRKDNGFDKSRYTLTGNMAEDVATIAKSQKGRTGADFGYTEPWCDEFVADCLENAGADSSIVGHGGNVADFERVMRNKGAVAVNTPQTGDLVFFYSSHVEIVTKVENGIVYIAGGNNGETGSYRTNYCRGERKIYESPRLYLRPNYKNVIPPEPSKPTLTVDANSASDKVTFSWNACSNTDRYDLRVYSEGMTGDNYFIYQQTTDTSLTYTLPEGKWWANVVAVNNTATDHETYGWSEENHFSVNFGYPEPKAMTTYNGHIYALYEATT